MFCQEPFCCSMWETTIYCTDKYNHTNILWHMHISKWILEGKPYRFLMDVILFCIFYSVFGIFVMRSFLLYLVHKHLNIFQ